MKNELGKSSMLKTTLRKWEGAIERHGKLDSFSICAGLLTLGNYIRTRDKNKQLHCLIKRIRDIAISPAYDSGELLGYIKKALPHLEFDEQTNSLSLRPAKNLKPAKKEKKAGQDTRFRGETRRIFKERLKFKDGMLLRNFDVETENARDSRKVRRIVEKRMCQAYHRMNKRAQDGMPSNDERYWMRRATSFQLYNVGQVENVCGISRGESTHWKRMFDPQTGKVVLKKKTAYPSKESALKAIEQWRKKHPDDTRKMSAYKCAICQKWHIGHTSSQMRKKLQEVA